MFIESGPPVALCALCRVRVADTVVHCRVSVGAPASAFTAPACRECTRLRLPETITFDITHGGAKIAAARVTFTADLADL